MPATEIVENTLILIGVFAFALSGALLAVREKFDIVGMAVLATATAVGGGVIRDVLIGDVPPAALTDPWSLLLPLGAAVLTFFFHPRVARMGRTVQLFERSGSVSSVPRRPPRRQPPASHSWRRSSSAPSPESVAASSETSWPGRPHPCSDGLGLYAIPAVAGSVVVAVAYSFGHSNTAIQAVAAVGMCGFRLLALKFKWHAPVVTSPRP